MILQFSILAGILQLGFPSGKLFSGGIPILGSGGFSGKILRLADVPQPKRGIEVLDLPLQLAVDLSQSGGIHLPVQMFSS